MQPIEITYETFSQYLIKIFVEKNFVDRNLANYRRIIADVEVRLSSKVDPLKGKLRELEMKFLQESESNSIYPNADSALADKDEYNNIINKLRYLKIVKKEII